MSAVYDAGKHPELFDGDESSIESLFVDSRNRIWIGTSRQFDPQTVGRSAERSIRRDAKLRDDVRRFTTQDMVRKLFERNVVPLE